MRKEDAFPMIEALEGRTLLSTPPLLAEHARPADTVTRTHAKRATPKTYLVSFYGLGGVGFGNAELSKIATEAGKATGAVVRKYQETQGTVALQNFFSSVDSNHDHTISSDEIANVRVEVLGYSFGAIQAVNFTRSLGMGGQVIGGYMLDASVPVQTLVTIDPVNYTPLKHTDGVLGNVAQFVNYYERNPGESSIHLSSKKTGQAAGDATFTDIINPIGGTLATAAASSQQILVDFGDWAGRSVTHPYNSKYNGTMTGAEVNHSTMPWYLHEDVVAALG